MAWMILLALLALSAIPLYSYLSVGSPLNDAQTNSLQITAESWRHRHAMYQGDISLESIVPISKGQPQLNQPPGTVWLNQLAFTSLDPLTTTDAQLAYQIRLVTAAFGLLTIAAVFWAGFSVGGLKTASFAALTILACPALILFARAGSPDMPLVALETLSIASAMWALRPLRPAPSLPRQAMGWIICGLALGMAVLTGGLPAMPVILLPIFVISIMCPNRISHLMGLVASIFIAALMVMPWALYVHGQDMYIWEQWVNRLWPTSLDSPASFWRAVSDRGLLAGVVVLPWTLWLIGSLVQPFSASSSGVRRRVFIGWVWLLCVLLLVVTGPGGDGLATMLPILPAAAILIGQCLRLFSDLSAEARHARTWRLTRWPHLALFAVASVALPAGMYFQSTLVDLDYLKQPIVAPMAWYFWLGLCASLLLITALSTRFAMRHYPGKAMVCWSLWAVVLMSVILIPLSRGPLMNPANTTPPTASISLPGGP
jgi:4-amino-4-deoxy-L-arabinose transferase-like glycosyltransferase